MKVIKNIMQAGILGTLAYYIIGFVLTTLITATDSVTTFFTTIVPIAVAFAVVWYMISASFRNND